MERREDIRSAIQKLLSVSRQPETPVHPEHPLGTDATSGTGSVILSDTQFATLREIQDTLLANHIEAEVPDIIHAMLEALSSRPSLCRGLIAAYLLGA